MRVFRNRLGTRVTNNAVHTSRQAQGVSIDFSILFNLQSSFDRGMRNPAKAFHRIGSLWEEIIHALCPSGRFLEAEDSEDKLPENAAESAGPGPRVWGGHAADKKQGWIEQPNDIIVLLESCGQFKLATKISTHVFENYKGFRVCPEGHCK